MDVFELPGNKNIGKLFSKYKLLFPNQASSSSDPSQILILQHPIPMSFLPPSPSLANFALDNWKTLLNNPHHALLWIPYLFLPYSTISHNYWIYKIIYQDKPTKSIIMHIQVIKPYIGQTLYSPQNGRPTCTYINRHNLHQKFIPPFQPIFTSLFHSQLIHKTILIIPTNTPSLYNSRIFKLLQKLFLYLSHSTSSGFIKGSMNKGVLWGLTLF